MKTVKQIVLTYDSIKPSGWEVEVYGDELMGGAQAGNLNQAIEMARDIAKTLKATILEHKDFK